MLFSILVALGYGVGVVNAFVSLFQFLESRTDPASRQRAFTFLVVAITVVTITYLLANQQPKVQGYGPSASSTSTISTSQSGTGITPAETLTPSPTSIPSTPTPSIKPGDILYQANQSWSGWSGSTDWHLASGMLINDGTSDTQEEPTILAPYQLGSITNYAVEANIQVVNWQQCCIAEFGMIVRASINSYGNWQGYTIGDVINSFAGSQYVAAISNRAGDYGGSLSSAPFAPGNASHIYRIELRGNDIKLFID